MIKLSDKWGYLNGILISFTLLLLGFLLDGMIGVLPWSMPNWPNNLVFIAVFIGVAIVWGFLPGGKLKSALTKVEMYWPGTILLLMASAVWVNIPVDNPAYLKLFSLFSGFTFMFLFLYLMLCYVLVTVKSVKNWNRKVVFSLSIHLGLMLLFTSVILGHGDYYQLQMRVGKDRAIFSGQNYDGKQLRTPFAVKFMDFHLEGENPGVSLINENKLSEEIVVIRNQDMISIGDYSVTLNNYLPGAIKTDAGYLASDTAKNAVHAVYALVKAGSEDLLAEGWITSGSETYKPLSLPLINEKLILTLEGRGDRAATIRLFDTPKLFTDYSLDDERPIAYKGWVIEQGDHDLRYGKHSPVLDLTLTFDRWLEVRIAGLILVLISLIGLWFFRKKTSKLMTTE